MTELQLDFITSSEFPAVAYGNREGIVIVRLDVANEAEDKAAMDDIRRRCLQRLGLFGVVDGIAVALLDRCCNPSVAGFAFGTYRVIFGRLTPKADTGDAVEWLERLYATPIPGEV